MKTFFKDKKNLVILLLVLLCIFRIPSAGIRFIFWVLAGVIISASCDFFIKRLFRKQSQIPKSAIISGFIVAGIIDYGQALYILAIFSSLAIISKYTFRFGQKHIFNPANFALFLASLFKVPLTWSIESNIYIIIAGGIYLAYTLKKLPHIFGFLVFSSGLFLLEGITPFSLISWFFLFIMLIEPKTSGSGLKRGFIFGSLTAVSSFLIFKFFPQIDIFTSSLVVANITRPVLDKIRALE